MNKKIEISERTIIFSLTIVFLSWFLFVIRDVIFQFFIAILIMSILNPMVDKLEKRKIPRGASVLLLYIFGFLLVSFIVSAIVPPLIEQTTNFVNNIPLYMQNLQLPPFWNEEITRQLAVEFVSLPSKIARSVFSLVSNLLVLIAILVFSFYLITQKNIVDKELADVLDLEKRKRIKRIINTLEIRIGSWARGELILMLAVGCLNYIGLKLIGIPYALPLGILAGILEIVPYIGPILAAVPAVLIGISISPIIGLAAALLSFLVQQFENYVLVPKVMQRVAGVNPIVTLLCLAIGLRIAGILGLFVAVPTFMTIQIVAREIFLSRGKG